MTTTAQSLKSFISSSCTVAHEVARFYECALKLKIVKDATATNRKDRTRLLHAALTSDEVAKKLDRAYNAWRYKSPKKGAK